MSEIDESCLYPGVCAACGRDVDAHISRVYADEIGDEKVRSYRITLNQCLQSESAYVVAKKDIKAVAFASARRKFFGEHDPFGGHEDIQKIAKRIFTANKKVWKKEIDDEPLEPFYDYGSVIILVSDHRTGQSWITNGGS